MSKFNSDLAEQLYLKSLDGLHSDGLGEVDGFGWYGLFENDLAILSEDSSGFIHVTVYNCQEDMFDEWDHLTGEWESWCDDEEADLRDYDYAGDDYFDDLGGSDLADSDLWNEY